MNSTQKKHAIPEDKELLKRLLNSENRAKLVIENRLRKWIIDYGDQNEHCESEKIERYLITKKKSKKQRIAYDNRNYMKSLVNPHLGHLKVPTVPAHWKIEPNNKNYIKSLVNEHLGMHRHAEPSEEKWPVYHNNQSYIKTFVNAHKGAFRDAPEPAEKWHVHHNNQNYINSLVNHQKGMHRIGPKEEEKWHINPDNRNYIRTYVNDHRGAYLNASGIKAKWEVHPDNRNYIKSCVNEHKGLHRLSSELLSMNGFIRRASKSDIDVVDIGKERPHDLFKVKYDKRVKILKGNEITVIQESKEDMESHVEYNWGFAFLQDDVPHVSLEKKVSRGGYRFHGVVRNIYDYDADASEDDLTTFVELRPHHQRRTKSKDYRKPGTIRAGFDTDEQIYRARKSSVDQIPDISSATKNTLSYFKEQVGKNAPSKWEELAPQPKITNISSREKGGTEYLKGNYAQGMPEQSTSGVADTLAYYQQKVAPPKPQKKPTEIADTLSYFHQKVAPKQPVMQMETPTHPPEGAYIRTNQTDANVKRTKINRGRESGSFFSSVEDIDEHRSHANDYGTRHHSRFEEFSNNKGCDMYIVNEEKYSELFHPGKG